MLQSIYIQKVSNGYIVVGEWQGEHVEEHAEEHYVAPESKNDKALMTVVKRVLVANAPKLQNIMRAMTTPMGTTLVEGAQYGCHFCPTNFNSQHERNEHEMKYHSDRAEVPDEANTQTNGE